MGKKRTVITHNERVQTDNISVTDGNCLQPNEYFEVEKISSKENVHGFVLHSHKHYEIYFLTSGTRHIFFSNDFVTISAPAILIVPPHCLHTTEGGSYERYNVNVSPNYLNDLQIRILDKLKLCVLKPTAEQTRGLVSIVDEMLTLDDQDPYMDQIINTLFSYYVYEMRKLDVNASIKNAKVGFESVADGNSIPVSLMKMLRYINDNFPEKITMDDLSVHFAMSKGSINYNFNKYLKMTPIDYLINIRLIRSTAYLENTDLSISLIAEKCGFMSPNHYTLMFKRKNGVSPSEYRRQKRG